MFDNELTSDLLVYNTLKNCQDEFIKSCNLQFINRSVPASENNTIYVAGIGLDNQTDNFDGCKYRASVNVYVKTKNTDYLTGSKFLRTVVKHIKRVLRDDDECRRRNISFRNISYEYGSEYTLKGLHLLINLTEFEYYNTDDDYSCIHDDSTNLKVDLK